MKGPSTALMLKPAEERFATEYLLDLNGTQAMLRANPKLAPESAAVQACRLLRRAQVQTRITELMEIRAAHLHIQAGEVLARLWGIATADPRELVSVHVRPCPVCWAPATGVPPDNRRQLPAKPNPDCLQCCGEGEPKAIYSDTRLLSPKAALLYAGAHEGRRGHIGITMHDQLQALELVGRHLGLWRDTGLNTGDGVDPIADLLKEIREEHLKEQGQAPAASQPVASVTGRPSPARHVWRAVTNDDHFLSNS